MTGEYISRAALLLQYYSALGELMEEGRKTEIAVQPAGREGTLEEFDLHHGQSRTAVA